MTRYHAVTGILIASACVLLVSCNSQPVQPKGMEGEAGKVQDLVYKTAEVWNIKEDFDNLYVQGAAPSDRERESFQGTSVQPITVDVSDDTATIEMEVTKFVNFEPNTKTVTWEAKREGDVWKLSKTPRE